MTEEKDGRRRLKLIYRGNMLEHIELDGNQLKGLPSLMNESGAVPSIEQLKKEYILVYEEIK